MVPFLSTFHSVFTSLVKSQRVRENELGEENRKSSGGPAVTSEKTTSNSRPAKSSLPSKDIERHRPMLRHVGRFASLQRFASRTTTQLGAARGVARETSCVLHSLRRPDSFFLATVCTGLASFFTGICDAKPRIIARP